MINSCDTTLGELVSAFYDEFLELYGDEDLASVAAAALVNNLLTGGGEVDAEDAAA
ncbi:MAG: hypothetical protein QGG40_18640 [Myxococcota bacterium]|nr:hypothetical protein [Myxococcota bacterium]